MAVALHTKYASPAKQAETRLLTGTEREREFLIWDDRSSEPKLHRVSD